MGRKKRPRAGGGGSLRRINKAGCLDEGTEAATMARFWQGFLRLAKFGHVVKVALVTF